MKLIILAISAILVGCSTPVPITPKFPQAPDALMQPCPDLKKLEKDAKLSDVARTVVENYTLYHECSVKSQSWIEWYKAHKKVFEDVK
jgi:hypothetical protein